MVHQYYDWNNLITEYDKAQYINDIRTAVQQGNYLVDQPKYQTNFTVFDRPEWHWTKLKYSFIMSAYDFLGRQVPMVGVRSWAFMTSLEHAEDREKLWHHHHADEEYNTVSGVFYIKVPVLDDDCGTEFAPNGPEESERVMLPPKEGQWLMYWSKEWHRPGIVKSMDQRFIVAADMVFKEL